MLGLHFCARAFSSCGKRGPLFIAVRRPLTIAASLVAEHRLQTRRLSSCGSRAQLLCGMWDLPRPGLEPASPALAGGLPTTAPPGKLHGNFLTKGPHFHCAPVPANYIASPVHGLPDEKTSPERDNGHSGSHCLFVIKPGRNPQSCVFPSHTESHSAVSLCLGQERQTLASRPRGSVLCCCVCSRWASATLCGRWQSSC